MTKVMRTAVGYARTSSHMNPKASIPNQCELIKRYSEKNGLLLKEIYIDESKTATMVQGREGYMKLKEALELGDIDMVIVSFFDRLAREAFEFILTVVELNKKGIDIVSISEDLSCRKMSPIHLAMIAFEIEHENKQRTERIHGAIQENRKKGIYNMPYIPYGYIKDKDSRLTIDHSKALLVKKIYNVYINCKSLAETIVQFDGIDGLNQSKIISILENKTYTGFIYTKKSGKDKAIEFIKKSFVQHPTIIDNKTFEMARILREKERRPVRNYARPHILKYLLKCPRCYSKMKASKGTYYCRTCKAQNLVFQQEEIESKFFSWIHNLLYEMEQKVNSSNAFRPLEVEEIENKKKKVEELYSKAKISFHDFQQKINILNEQLSEMTKKAYSNNSFKIKYEIKDLIKNKAWSKIIQIMLEENMYITFDEEIQNIKLCDIG